MKRFSSLRCNAVTLTAGLGLLCALLIALGCGLYHVYERRDEGNALRLFAGWMPAARVGSDFVPYGRFLKSRAAMRTYLGSSLAKSEGIDPALTPALEKAALMRLMREKVINKMARERNVTVPDKDVQDSFDTMVMSASSTIPDPTAYLKDTFGWTREDYIDNIVRPAIVEERVGATMASDTQAQFEAVQKAVDAELDGPSAKIYLRFE